MKLEVLTETENEDGSLNVTINLDDEMWRLLIQLGFDKLLEGVVKVENAKEDQGMGGEE